MNLWLEGLAEHPARLGVIGQAWWNLRAEAQDRQADENGSIDVRFSLPLRQWPQSLHQ